MPQAKKDAPARPAGKPAAKSAAKPAAKPAGKSAGKSAAQASTSGGGGSTTLITVVLALLLLAVGAAGYEAATLLHYAITKPAGVNGSAASTAAFACDALKRQDYQRLVTYIDPSPIPPTVTGAFDSRLTITQLRTRDTQEGKVVSCVVAPYAAGSIVSADGATRYQLTLRRANAPVTTTGTLNLRQQTGGQHGWLIGRDSSFLTPPAA